MTESTTPQVTPVLGSTEVTNLDHATFTDDASGTVEYDSRDWGFFLEAPTGIPDAKARRYEKTVPGRDGVLDLTDALGVVNFENRAIELSFVYQCGTQSNYHLMASDMRNTLDGKRWRVTLKHDASWYWVGRCQVDTSKVGAEAMRLVVRIDAEPFKRSVQSSYEAWKWSPFSFVDGVVTNPSDVELTGGTATVSLPRDDAASKVTLWLNSGSADAKTSTDKTWHALKPGANRIPEIRMSRDGATVLQLRGTGTVGVEYRLGSL